MKLNDFFDEFIEYRALLVRDVTLYNNIAHLKKDIFPFFENKEVNEISELDILRWIKMLDEFLWNGTIYIRKVIFKIYMDFALTKGYISENVVAKTPFSRHQNRKKPVHLWGAKEYIMFIECLKYHNVWTLEKEIVIRLLLLNGLRSEEYRAIQLYKIDFGRNCISILDAVNTQMDTVQVRKLHKTKTSFGIREAPIDALTMSLIQLHINSFKVKNKETFLFHHPKTGNPRSSNFMLSTFRRYSKIAGIPTVTPRELRHSYVNNARKAGVDIGIISKSVGHASITTTAKYYYHVATDEIFQANEQMMKYMDI
ncbi:tyrosine-type recombinase/integrase [Listeria booriae]|uniref:tyrosine-type recombinase/integrase n=1 Tax=Listeria booriae TaxID=1552123 RepID=UPI001629D2D8|nr:tyrosine-type recombinase/integrase [Listeria booriae]MBC2327225.1 tyrosine-type recombinase/integrase [Listeria booriae]